MSGLCYVPVALLQGESVCCSKECGLTSQWTATWHVTMRVLCSMTQHRVMQLTNFTDTHIYEILAESVSCCLDTSPTMRLLKGWGVTLGRNKSHFEGAIPSVVQSFGRAMNLLHNNSVTLTSFCMAVSRIMPAPEFCAMWLTDSVPSDVRLRETLCA
jgi:hypothetical protein